MDDKRTHLKGCPQAPYDPTSLLETFSTSTECLCDEPKAVNGEWVFDITHPSPLESEYGWKQELREQGITDWEVKHLDNGDFEIEYNLGKNDFSIDFNIKLEDYSNSCAPLCEVFRSSEAHNHFVMYNSKNEMMVDMDLDDGTIIFGETYTPDEAAKTFWDTIGKMGNQNLPEEPIYVSAPPGIADDMPAEYMKGTVGNPINSLEEAKQVVKKITSDHFDNTMKGLIDG